jgi:hypothetical protein
LTSKPDYNKIETISKIENIEDKDGISNYELIVKELKLDLQWYNAEVESMNKQLNKMYKEIYELNDIIKTLTKNGKKN